MGEILSNYYEKIAKAYTSEDWENFFKQNSALIRYGRKIPINYFYRYQNTLMTVINKYGVAPFLSWIIEYGYRLVKQSNKQAISLFKELVVIFRKSEKKMHEAAPVLVRKSSELISPKYLVKI
jgi:hypothetical protein